MLGRIGTKIEQKNMTERVGRRYSLISSENCLLCFFNPDNLRLSASQVEKTEGIATLRILSLASHE
jgi:hypothetical protein